MSSPPSDAPAVRSLLDLPVDVLDVLFERCCFEALQTLLITCTTLRQPITATLRSDAWRQRKGNAEDIFIAACSSGVFSCMHARARTLD